MKGVHDLFQVVLCKHGELGEVEICSTDPCLAFLIERNYSFFRRILSFFTSIFAAFSQWKVDQVHSFVYKEAVSKAEEWRKSSGRE